MLQDTCIDACPIATEATEPAKSPVDLAQIDTLHQLLALALDDFEKVLADPRYAIDVGGTYHDSAPDSRDRKRCDVCLAGAVMAKSLGVSPGQTSTPNAFGDAVENRLYALDSLRSGEVLDALELIGDCGCTSCEPECAWCEKAGEAAALTDIWEAELCGLASAQGRHDGRLLLAKLRLMQRELKAADI